MIIGASIPKKFNFFSWVITKYIKQDYSHIYLEYFDPFVEQALIIEASHGEQHKITKENWLKKNRVIKEIRIGLDVNELKNILYYVNSTLQTKYSFKNIIGMPFYDLYEKTKIFLFFKIALFFSDNKNGLICSEVAARVGKLLNISFERPLDYIRPDHIIKKLYFLSLNNSKIKVIR